MDKLEDIRENITKQRIMNIRLCGQCFTGCGKLRGMCGISLAALIFIYAVYTIIASAIVVSSTMKPLDPADKTMKTGNLVIQVCAGLSFLSGLMGLLSVFVRAPVLCGVFCFTTMLCAGFDLAEISCSIFLGRASTKTLVLSPLHCLFTCVMINAIFSYYAVLVAGGTGCEMMNSEEIIAKNHAPEVRNYINGVPYTFVPIPSSASNSPFGADSPVSCNHVNLHTTEKTPLNQSIAYIQSNNQARNCDGMA